MQRWGAVMGTDLGAEPRGRAGRLDVGKEDKGKGGVSQVWGSCLWVGESGWCY